MVTLQTREVNTASADPAGLAPIIEGRTWPTVTDFLVPSGDVTGPRGGTLVMPFERIDAPLDARLVWEGRTFLGLAQGALLASLGGFAGLIGGRAFGTRLVRPTVVFRTGDRITYAGTAVDLSGQVLRQVQLQFIGETVQDNFAGSGTDLNGIFVAYLPTGDSYRAYAFSPSTGITWSLERIVDLENSVRMEFRQVTRRGGFGEGIFLGSY